MTDYVVALEVGAWSATWEQESPDTRDADVHEVPAGGVYALAGLELTWDTDEDEFPGRPTPSQLKFQLYVPDRLAAPDPRQGDLCSFTLTTQGYQRNRLPNANLVADLITGYTATRTTMVRNQGSDGRWRLQLTVNDATAGALNQRVSTPVVACSPGETCWGAAEVMAGVGSGITTAAAQLVFVDAAGADLALGQPPRGADVVVSAAAYTLVSSRVDTAPDGAAGFRVRFGPTTPAQVQVADVFYVRDPFLAVGLEDDTFGYNRDNLEPVATFDGRVADCEAGVYLDGLLYSVNAVDFVSQLNEANVGDEPWPEETWEGESFDPLLPKLDPLDPPLKGRYNRVARLATELLGGGLRVVHNPTAPFSGTTLEAHDKVAADANGVFGTLVIEKPRDVDSQPVGDLLERMCRDVVMGVNPGRKELRLLPGNHNSGQHPAMSYWLTPYMGQGVDDSGSVSLFYVWATSRVLDNAHASQLTLGDDGVLRLEDKHVSTIQPGCAIHVPASVVYREGVTWRMDKAVSPNTFREDSNGVTPLVFFNEKDGAFLYAFWNDGTQDWEWRVPAYQVAWWPLVRRNGAVTVQRDNDTTNDLGAPRFAPVIGRYYDAQAVYMVDKLTIEPGDLDGEDWPRCFAHRNPWGYFTGHVGRWVYIHGIDDRWNPHPHGLYFGQLTGATLRIDAGGKVTIDVQLRHREPGAAGPTGAVHLEDIPDGVKPTDVAAGVRFVDLSVTDRTVNVIP